MTRTIEWSCFACEQAVLGSILLNIGGIIGVAGFFNYWQFAAVCIPTSIVVLLLEWPRSKRKKGNTEGRMFQEYITPLVKSLGTVSRNYFIRSAILLIVSVPSCFLLPTILGGLSLQIAAIIYAWAAFKKEEWQPLESTTELTSPSNRPLPPVTPPPRPSNCV